MVKTTGVQFSMAQFHALEKEFAKLKEKLWCSECELPYGAFLSDRDIRRLIQKGRIKIDPLPNLKIGKGGDLGTCKVDLHLGPEALIIDATRLTHIDLAGPIPDEYFRKIDVRKLGELKIHSGEVVLARTLEKVVLPDDIAGRIEGKSSVARRGVSVQAAPLFDAGWNGYPVLELNNVGKLPAVAKYGSSICAMSFNHLSSSTFQSYAKRDGVRYGVQKKTQV